MTDYTVRDATVMLVEKIVLELAQRLSAEGEMTAVSTLLAINAEELV